MSQRRQFLGAVALGTAAVPSLLQAQAAPKALRCLR
ncbi:MAG: hypothetical protein JWR60_1744 [Polaromonas sp.]|nr:hypothetical protein [Polaromonas sp.]